MFDRLVVHAHVPKSGSGALNRTVFFRRFTRGETMIAYGGDYGQVARLPGEDRREAAQRLGRASLAVGHVPYGYFDGFGRWTIYISVFVDPVQRFLRFADAIFAARARAAAKLFGDEEAAPPVDPEQMIDGLLKLDDVQQRRTNVMTRIAAGLPAFGAFTPGREHLDVACANVARSNYLVATRDRMPEFERCLGKVLGVSCAGRGMGGWTRTPPTGGNVGVTPIVRADLSARLLRRVEVANDLDLRLFDAVARQSEVCWA